MDKSLDGFERQAMLVAAAAAAIAAAIGYIAVANSYHPGPLGVVVALGSAIAALVLLTRTPMPGQIRTALMMALIVAVLGLSLRADFLLIKPVQVEMDSALRRDDDGWIPPSGSGGYPVRGPAATPGAELTISGLSEAAPWARHADEVLTGRIGADIPGADAWHIQGTAAPGAMSESNALSIDWHIAGSSGEAQCGLLSISATEPGAAFAVLRDRFRRAIRASIRANRADCG